MEITLPEAYAAACKMIGEQAVQMQFMAKALQEAKAREDAWAQRGDPKEPSNA